MCDNVVECITEREGSKMAELVNRWAVTRGYDKGAQIC